MKPTVSSVDTRKVVFIDLRKDVGHVPQIQSDDWELVSFCSFSSASIFISKNHVHVVTLSVNSSDFSATLQIAKKLNHDFPHIVLIGLLSESSKLSSLPKDLINYFWDFHHLPIQLDYFTRSLGHAFGLSELKLKQTSVLDSKESLRFIANSSSHLKKINSVISDYAAVECPVLISGETGTGKGLCAAMIHDRSRRSTGPMVSINCGALPESLIQSELFGHEKGAFTGAYKKHIGHIERADSGTLFLDEIGDLSLNTQVQLLYFLETKQITRVGSTTPFKVDCRLIFASHIDLYEAVLEGSFREDLYYRLAVLTVSMPSLRSLNDDRILIADYYVERYSGGAKKLSASAKRIVKSYQWPGNVRELKNRIQRACIMSKSESIYPRDLGIESHISASTNNVYPITSHRSNPGISSRKLLSTLERCENNVSAAARELNISRTTFYRMLKRTQESQ